MSHLRAGALTLLLAIVLLLPACGGDGGGNAEEWAGSVCGDVSEWLTDVDGALETIGAEGLGLDEADLREAVDRVGEATDELTGDLGQLGPPEIDAAERAREELEKLLAELREQYDAAEQALAASLEPLETIARLASALAAAANQLQATFDELEGLDPGGELADGFRESDDCVALREQIADLGS